MNKLFHTRPGRAVTVSLLVAAGMLTALCNARAQLTGEVTTLRSFNGVNGQAPAFGLTAGKDGNFYGLLGGGGSSYNGVFIRITPDGSLTLLHGFSYGTDGDQPECALLLASDGNFYGEAAFGGSGYDGTVFRITLDGTLTVLHAFSNNDTAHGRQPVGGLTQGSDGMLYGTTQTGGPSDDGTIFRLALDGTFTLLHAFDFSKTGAGPATPQFPPVQGSDGNFYGVAGGGDNGLGSIYKMTPDGMVTTIHSFSKTDGRGPRGVLLEGSSGVFYGVTSGGGGKTGDGYGTIFKITSAGQLTTLHSFVYGFNNPDGNTPQSGLIRAADGNFYGTTVYGGRGGSGCIYQCTPDGVVTPFYGFLSNSTAGYYPSGALVQAADGSFYGTTGSGGVNGLGVVYHLTVGPHPPIFDGQVDLGNGVEYLLFASGNPFGYYSYLTDAHYIYHFDLGYEYVFDANDGMAGVYLYDFKSSTFFYTSPAFPFPYLYDFTLNTVLYYFPTPGQPGRYNTQGVRYFYNFATGKVISK